MTSRSEIRVLKVGGYRSLGDASLELGPLTVLIGANGAGKSNLLDTLRLLEAVRRGGLRAFVGQAGGASTLLHRGKWPSTRIHCVLTYSVSDPPPGIGHAGLIYDLMLAPTEDDGLIIEHEFLEFERSDQPELAVLPGSRGTRESTLLDESKPDSPLLLAPPVSQIYHFHDTALGAPLRTYAQGNDDASLRADGGNLAAFLRRLALSQTDVDRVSWGTILRKTREIAPQVHRLRPTEASVSGAVRLDWEDVYGNVFGCHQLSDGTLRAIALLAALNQPVASRPPIMAFDEPELGLHPAALATIAGALRVASAHSQVVVATQSPALLDEVPFEAIVVCEHGEHGSALKRLTTAELDAWLDSYAMSDLWHMNVLGGRP